MKPAIRLIYSGGKLTFSGSLTMDTVPDAEQQFTALKSKLNDGFDVDLQDVDTVDSAGMAMLINIKARFDVKKSSMQFINAPESLKRLSKLSDADTLLQI